MNLNRIKAYGTSTTRKAWIINPIRSLLWKIYEPYFHGMILEVEKKQQIELLQLYEKLGLNQRNELNHFRQDGNSKLDNVRAAYRDDMTSNIASANKDVIAIAHRLGGLEEEAFNHEQTLANISQKLEKEAVKIHEVVTYVAALRNEITISVEDFSKHIDDFNKRLGDCNKRLDDFNNSAE